ncbi:hypothetical protein L226DRAFT_517508 [Lentinus tigrinus ALCF2SS1-7]|uniref:ribonuclease H n=1 Tax=Lentinus tigrinus ALCF2SS1-6 TaxID=1328759 RepID=A0A5C2RPV0_9APHY|nr:hypothetical protein L227DRAFT_514053 [Lentinus tigrinus ALCF2SS1-6]RPD68213.1 hypothetical protein L226DRAFT_517508 [Lentinus tigrinus ALCF2SS1-7]
MAKDSTPGFYSVTRGRVPGVHSTWYTQIALAPAQQVSGFTGNKHHRFPTIERATAYLAQHGATNGNFSTTASSSAPPASRKGHDSKPYQRPTPTNGKPEEKTHGSSLRWAALTTEVIEDESGWNVVYSDGERKVGFVVGIGVWWGGADPRNIAERCPGGQTNNRTELIDIARVLETSPHVQKSLFIKGTQNTVSCFRQWMPKWLHNGFKMSTREPVKNAPLIRYLLNQRAREGQKVPCVLS